MGNKFGNYASQEIAEKAIEAEGFRKSDTGLWVKNDMTGGSLMTAPRACKAIVEITSYRVDGKWAADGRDYHVYQHHFL